VIFLFSINFNLKLFSINVPKVVKKAGWEYILRFDMLILVNFYKLT
jgi:hypothetical protein